MPPLPQEELGWRQAVSSSILRLQWWWMGENDAYRHSIFLAIVVRISFCPISDDRPGSSNLFPLLEWAMGQLSLCLRGLSISKCRNEVQGGLVTRQGHMANNWPFCMVTQEVGSRAHSPPIYFILAAFHCTPVSWIHVYLP